MVKYEAEIDGKFSVLINFWSNDCEVYYEGEKLEEIERKTYLLGEEKCIIAGSLFSGIYLSRGEKKALLIRLKWYDYIACILPVLTGMLGSYIGVALGLFAAMAVSKIMPYLKKYFLRLLLGSFAAVIFVLVAAINVILSDLTIKGV